MSGRYLITTYGSLQVAWLPELDGGGRAFGQDYVPIVRHTFGRVDRLFEFCAGPGYIGFSLLAHGCCNHLVLADVNPVAVSAMQETVRLNGLEKQVTIYQSDALNDIPPHERWDLVVANPPHFSTQVSSAPSLITDDVDWRTHRSFYSRVGHHLAPGGSLLIQENSEGSTPEKFLSFIDTGGLSHVRTLWYRAGQAGPSFYYLWVKKNLPGLLFDTEPFALRVVLRDGSPTLRIAPRERSSAVSLVNDTGRQVKPKLVDKTGASLFWLPFEEIAAGQEVLLPRMALPPGSYDVHDEVRDVSLARLIVTGDTPS
jgi:methylase of polypeptide subunit release factors